MKCSNLILNKYLDGLNVSGKEFAEKITLTGTKVESYEILDKNLEKIVVAKIEKIEKHKDADKLVICNVDIGTEKIQIVTGAPNVYEGMLCPAVLVGGKVSASAHDNNEYPDGIKIKEGKLRGVLSCGMLCSIDELGRPSDLYGDIDGIFDLSNFDCKVGDNAIEVLELNDCIYDFEITSNRIDCYSILGIAKEVSATFNLNFKKPNESFKPTFSDKNYIKIDVEDEILCKAFTTRYIKNIKIKDSPIWLKNYLRKVGIRPINNIVDITNFVMFEYGQPMHAYDYDKINDKHLIIKKAKNGDKFITLDGKERELDDDILTICDGKEIVGLAGIMGGENSMITSSCKNLLLECANFDSVNIRKTSKKLGLRTEASNLFEKGLDPNNAINAINRACSLIEELGAGEICEDFIYYFSNNTNFNEKNISVSINKINSLLGIEILPTQMKDILDKIDLKTEICDEKLNIFVPSIRKDINNYADIAEEIIRFYGYDKLNKTLPHINYELATNDLNDIVMQKVYDIAIYNGFNEAMNYSFESKKVYDMLGFSENAIERKFIKISNPLGEDFQIMRTQLVNGILKSLSLNYNRRNKEAKLFEIANVYLPLDENILVLPDERKTLIMGAYAEKFDFFEMKNIALQIFESCNIKNKLDFVKNDKISYMHSGRTANIFCGDINLGFIGEVNELILKNYEIGNKVYILQIDLKNLISISSFNNKYAPISKFPKSERDLSLIVPKNIIASDIEKIFDKNGGKILLEYNLFDIYEGEQVKDGFKSLTYNLVYGSNDKSLVDEEVDASINKILEKLALVGIEIRK